MKLSDFDYYLPPLLIAQTPLENRSASRLMVLDKITGTTQHRKFLEIVELLKPGDVLVFNDSRVYRARLFGQRSTGGKIEIFLVRDLGAGIWQCMLRAKKPRLNEKIILTSDIWAEVIGVNDDSTYNLQFNVSSPKVWQHCADFGQTPLPPYIKVKDSNEFEERYQTVYAKKLGSVAAPTAGLHFDQELIVKLKEKGVQIEHLTLHVGLGTFLPVKTDNILEHKMHNELAEITPEVAQRLNLAKSEDRRIIAVGTTSARTLEAFSQNGRIVAPKKEVDIFIYPGYNFKSVDGLITNFHLPKSTLLMMVSALAGRENVLQAYNEAIVKEYRFFSFGDAMLII